MLTATLTALLLTAGEAQPSPRIAGVAGHGLGLEINASVGLHTSSGPNESRNILAPQWEAGLRLRIGQFFSVGVSGEYVHGISGGPGDDWDYERKQIAADLQWRFWGYRGILRPWVGVGMAWGSIYSFHRDESLPPVDAHVWEFLRSSVGLDVALDDHFVFGPWVRVGLASTPAYYPSEAGTLTTIVLGIRLTVVVP